jgi:hypothetical protein
MAEQEINGYKARGALQTAGIVGGLLIATVILTTFILDRIIGPNLIAKADDRFEQRIEKHNELIHERGINRQLTEVKQQQRRIIERLEKVVTKNDFDRFMKQYNRLIYGDGD